MSFDTSRLRDTIHTLYGNKPHPDAPDIKVKDYQAFARAAALMFYERYPSARQVTTTYHTLTSAGVAPGEFERIWNVAKPLANQLLDRNPDIHDVMALANRPPKDIQTYYSEHPHPEHPDVSAGEIARYATMARYPAARLRGGDPHLAELHKFAVGQYSMDDIVAHYKDQGR